MGVQHSRSGNMVLADRPHGTGLGAHLPLSFHKAHFTADIEFSEVTVQN